MRVLAKNVDGKWMGASEMQMFVSYLRTLEEEGRGGCSAASCCYCVSDYSAQPACVSVSGVPERAERMEELLSWAGRTSRHAESSPLALSVGAC